MTDPVTLAWIGLATSGMTGVLMIINTIITNSHTRELAKMGSAVQDTKVTIATLEKNTNSIKDELVKVTGQAAFAKGVKQGTEAAMAAGVPIPTGPSPIPIPLPVIVVEDPINPGDSKWKHESHDMGKKT